MFLLLIWTVFKLVHSNSKVEKNVTLFCILSVLVLLTHIMLKLKLLLLLFIKHTKKNKLFVFFFALGSSLDLILVFPYTPLLSSRYNTVHYNCTSNY